MAATESMGRTTLVWNCGGTCNLICWKRYSEAPKPPTTRTFWWSVSLYGFRGREKGSGRGEGGPYLEHSVLGLDGDDLVPDELENAVHDRFETLQDFFVRECHVAFFDTGVWEFGLDANVHGPFLTVVPKIGLDAVFEVHDAFRIHFPRRLRPIREFHFANLSAQDIAEVAVQCCRAARVA